MRFFRPLLTVLVLLAALAASAQPAAKPKARVLLYKERLAAQFDTVECVKNVFKINPLLFFRGEIPIYYERALTPRLSLQVGLGVTLRNYMALSFVGDDSDDFGAGTDIIPNPSFHMAARFYFADDLEPIGFYLEPEFAHLVYTKDISVKDNDGQLTDKTLRDERTYNDVRLMLGYQSIGISNNWVADFYGGLGFRDRQNVRVKERLDLTSSTYTYSVEPTHDNTLAFFLGVRLGFGF
jgi:hypothetical protein